MYTQIKGTVYINYFASTNIVAENITMNMTEAIGGMWFRTSCFFEGILNLADIKYRNIYMFTESEQPLATGGINFSGNANITISNVTIKVLTSAASISTMIGFMASQD